MCRRAQSQLINGERQVMLSQQDRCLPRFRRALSCTQHTYLELNNAAAQSCGAYNLIQPYTTSMVPATILCDGSIAGTLSQHRHIGTHSPSRVLSCCQHVYSELHIAVALSLDAHSLREALARKRRMRWLKSQLTSEADNPSAPSQACSQTRSPLPPSHASAACSAAASTSILSCTPRLHRLSTLSASERRSQASHAMAQPRN